MDARLLDVVHDRPDEHIPSIGDGVHVHLDGPLQEPVDQDGVVRGGVGGGADEVVQLVLPVHDLHGPSPQHVGGTDHDGIPDRRGDGSPRIEGRQRDDDSLSSELA